MVAASLTGEKHLRGGSGFGEGIFPVHVFDKIFSERNEKENSECSAQQGGEENLQEIDGEFRIFVLKDVERGERKDGTGDNHAGAGSDALNDDVFAQRIFAVSCAAESDGDDGDGDGGFKNLTDLQAEIGGGGGEENRHENTPADGPPSDFGIGLLWFHQRGVFFSLAKFAERVFRQFHLLHVFLFLHIFKDIKRLIGLRGAEEPLTRRLKRASKEVREMGILMSLIDSSTFT